MAVCAAEFHGGQSEVANGRNADHREQREIFSGRETAIVFDAKAA